MNTLTLAEKLRRIEDLDLDPIVVKLIDADEGEGWSLEQALCAERLYRRFLQLTVMHPEKSIVPTKVMDAVWHYHILDTRKYAHDCEHALGFFLHHFPYFGMRGEQDAKDLQNAFTSTKELFLTAFGETLEAAGASFQKVVAAQCDGSSGGSNDCGSCGSGATCTTSKCTAGVLERASYDFATRPSLTLEQQLVRSQLV